MGWFTPKQEKLDERFLAACEHGSREEVEQLLKDGANIAVKNDREWPAFYIAARDGQMDVIRYLIEKGVDINAVIPAGVTALDKALEQNKEDVAELLIAHGGRTKEFGSLLHGAAATGCFNIVKLLVQQGADVNAWDKDGNSPAALALKHNYPGIAEFLKEKILPSVPASPAAVTIGNTGWTLTAPDEIAFVEDKTAIGYSLTSIFNFSARTYTHISRNLKTNVESQTMRFFDEFTDKKLLEQAYEELARRHGTADKNAIYGAVLDKGRRL